MLCKPAIYL
jgi:hypothetical protein